MANIMSLKSLRNKPSRNGFDLSFKKNFTAKAGELLPIMVKEVLPGDSFQIDLRSFTRTQPINTAAFARMREYYDFFFVPYDLLWNKANTVLTQMYDNPQHALSIDPTQTFQLTGEMPYITAQSIANYISRVQVGSDSTTKNYFGYSRAKLSAKLLEYLGYGNFEPYTNGVSTSWSSAPLMANLQFNAFGLLAYQKIYADFYRDSQWERISPSTFNVDYLGGTSSMQLSISASAFMQNYNLFDLRYCNWQKDLFHGVVPNPQYGETASVPVTVTAATDTTPASAAFDVVLLRQYEFLQKWKEIAQSGNKDYKEQVEKHWNVSVGDGYSELCTYLGGSSSSIDINEVVNTNITSDNAADIAGKGVGVSNGKISFNSNGKYGLLMCIYHCLPLLDYTTDFVDPAFTKVNSADYAIPEFDRVGMQGVPFTHMTNPLKSVADASNLILGYAPRYIDYKTSFDCSVGAFKNSLSSWVMSYGNQSVVNQLGTPDENNRPSSTDGTPMNYTYFKVNPNSVNPIFAVEADDTVGTDQFLCSTFFDVKVVRNLDTDGLPY
ncbi:major capsid protein [uncultured Bacteroides sp.]|uniref:major capsid protein n=1 Tax=uncultured Bacteroides sp. TaxID=162156 RepID=UPI0025F4E0F4|nr:major capsid protein [uncultured Bacteroides sp.]